MLKTVTAFAALLAATAFVVPTVSQAQEVRSARVSYLDLDLASDMGQQSLQRRIFHAAESVCGIGTSGRDGEVVMVCAGSNRGKKRIKSSAIILLIRFLSISL